MKHSLLRNSAIFFVRNVAAGVQVSAEARVVAARYLKPNPVTTPEDVARNAGRDRHGIDLPGPGEHHSIKTVAISQPKDAIAEIARLTIRKHVDQLRREVCVGTCCR